MATDTSNFNFQGIGVVSALGVEGCMDSLALNYNASATVDDDSCIYPIYGCMNPLAVNYAPSANTDDGSCDFSSFINLGCTNIYACNFDPLALTDDGSCILPDGCTDPAADNYDVAFLCDDDSCEYGGCTDPIACNYNSNANVDDGSCILPDGCTDPLAVNYDVNAICDDGSCIGTVYGCMDATANNYNSNANVDDGGCTYTISGCTDSTANNYNSNANVDDGTCEFWGCTDTLGCNYDAIANVNDGSCIYPAGCNDPLYLEYVAGITCPNNPIACVTLIELGCTDPIACNYNLSANVDDGSCASYAGCTDPIACNYDSNAGCNDGSCVFPAACEDCTGDCLPNCTQILGICVPKVYGCIDNGTNVSGQGVATDIDGDGLPAFNYDPLANINATSATDNSNPCIPIIYGCTDAAALNSDCATALNPSSPTSCTDGVNTSDGTCIYSISGCMDVTAANYDPTATIDDGSCTFAVVSGCTDSTACNHDPSATTDDGSCYYATPIVPSPVSSLIYTGLSQSYLSHSVVYDAVLAMNTPSVPMDQYYFEKVVTNPSQHSPLVCYAGAVQASNKIYKISGITLRETPGMIIPTMVWYGHTSPMPSIDDVIAWLNTNVANVFDNTMDFGDIRALLDTYWNAPVGHLTFSVGAGPILCHECI